MTKARLCSEPLEIAAVCKGQGLLLGRVLCGRAKIEARGWLSPLQRLLLSGERTGNLERSSTALDRAGGSYNLWPWGRGQRSGWRKGRLLSRVMGEKLPATDRRLRSGEEGAEAPGDAGEGSMAGGRWASHCAGVDGN